MARSLKYVFSGVGGHESGSVLESPPIAPHILDDLKLAVCVCLVTGETAEVAGKISAERRLKA